MNEINTLTSLLPEIIAAGTLGMSDMVWTLSEVPVLLAFQLIIPL